MNPTINTIQQIKIKTVELKENQAEETQTQRVKTTSYYL